MRLSKRIQPLNTTLTAMSNIVMSGAKRFEAATWSLYNYKRILTLNYSEELEKCCAVFLISASVEHMFSILERRSFYQAERTDSSGCAVLRQVP